MMMIIDYQSQNVELLPLFPHQSFVCPLGCNARLRMVILRRSLQLFQLLRLQGKRCLSLRNYNGHFFIF